uniref:Thymic stromal cotransporter homolog n=1 Tax=Sinocyclocheilus rhinocerous TaxID=307959 RepID=A0A673IZ03_9TELE
YSIHTDPPTVGQVVTSANQMGAILTLVEPVVVINKLGTSFFDMALTQTVYNQSLKATAGDSDRAQTLSSHFLLIQSVLSSVAAMLSIIPLSRMADRHGPKVFLVASQMGSVLGMFTLVIFMYCEVPLEFLYLGSLLHGLSGGGPMFWAGVAALASLSSEQGKRTLKLNIVDFCFGVAGVVGGLLSGYLYQMGPSILLLTAILVSVVALLYSVFALTDSRRSLSESEPLLAESENGKTMDRVSVGMLMSTMVLFMLGMVGAENVLQLYVLKPPLSWDSIWAGYGRAATSTMYLSSFIGVLGLFKVLGDTALTLLGIVSNCTGMAIMAFTVESWSITKPAKLVLKNSPIIFYQNSSKIAFQNLLWENRGLGNTDYYCTFTRAQINSHDLFTDLVAANSVNDRMKENRLAVLHFYLSKISQRSLNSNLNVCRVFSPHQCKNSVCAGLPGFKKRFHY